MKYTLIILLFATFVIGQSKTGTPQNKVQSVQQKNTSLRSEIDSLKALRDSLQRRLRMELRDLYIIKYGEEAGGKISMGHIWTGMSEEMMRDSWGEPDSITVNDQKWGKYSQWYFGEITYFFKDGKLFEWESPDAKKE